MKRPSSYRAGLGLLLSLLMALSMSLVGSLSAHAAPSAPSGSGSATAGRLSPPGASASSTARPLTSAEKTGSLPVGHPPTTEGASSSSASPSAPSPPPGHHPADAMHEPPPPPQSASQDDSSLPARSILIETRDGSDQPVPNVEVTVGIIRQSVAQGESRQRRTERTGPTGTLLLTDLDTTSGTAYRVSTARDGASFAAPPFALSATTGKRVILYVFPVVQDIRLTNIAVQGFAYFEIRDEVIQIEVAYRLHNLGATTWVARDVEVKLPSDFKAFTAQAAMSDLGWDTTPGKGVRFRGTIPPGQTETAFRFQVPYDGSEEVSLDLGVLPRVQSFRVASDAPKGMSLRADGFPTAQPAANAKGQKVLLTERTVSNPAAAFQAVSVHFEHLPTRPVGRWIAVIAAGLFVVAGGVTAKRIAAQKRGANETQQEREHLLRGKEELLTELERLEHDHATGEVGPKTYETSRRELIDGLARIAMRLDALGAPPERKRKKKKAVA